MFGCSSERFVPEDPSQLSLAFDGEESLPEELEVEPEKTEVTYTRNKENNAKAVPCAIPDSIRREEVVIEPENIPEGAVRIADLPPQVLPRSNASASLLAYLLISEFLDHIPFYRLLEIFKRQKIFIAASNPLKLIDMIMPVSVIMG